MSWVPPGKVIAALTALPLARLAASASLNAVVSVPTLRSLYSLPTEMHCPARFRRARMYIGTCTLLAVIAPLLIR